MTPPAYYAALHQNELDDIHLQAKQQRRASVMKILARDGALTPESEAALLNGTPAMLVKVQDTGAVLDDIVKVIGSNVSINTLLHLEEEVLHSNAREALGISRNLTAEFAPTARTTAREIDEVAAGGELRLGRKQKNLRKSYKRLVWLLNGIVAAHWTAPRAVRVVGKDGAVRWEELSAEVLRSGRFTLDITFSAEHYQTPLSRQQEALQIYAQLMADPRVDQEALLQQLVAAYSSPGVKTKGGAGSDLQLSVPPVQGQGRKTPSGGGSA